MTEPTSSPDVPTPALPAEMQDADDGTTPDGTTASPTSTHAGVDGTGSNGNSGPPKDTLRAGMTDDERAFAAQLSEDESTSLKERIADLFEGLKDPLLSSKDVVELTQSKKGDVIDALQALVADDVLESSEVTLRPLDPPDTMVYRRKADAFETLTLYGLETHLSNGSSRYEWTCNGRIIRSLAKLQRLDASTGEGTQRQEIRKHIHQIAQSVNTGKLIPTPILLVLPEGQTIVADDGTVVDPDAYGANVVIAPVTSFTSVDGDRLPYQGPTRLVKVSFPYRAAAFEGEKLAWLADGQQRTAAIGLTSIDRLPNVDLSVSALVAGSAEQAKEIFLNANNSVSLPTDYRLLLESFTETQGTGPGRLVEQVTRDLSLTLSDSPFLNRVKIRSVAKVPTQVIVQATLRAVVKEFSGKTIPGLDTREGLRDAVSRAFKAVASTWPSDWGRKPGGGNGETYLSHGAGLRALATFLADRLAKHAPDGASVLSDTEWSKLSADLITLKDWVAWSQSGADAGTANAKQFYEEDVRGKQNTPTDIGKLTQRLKERHQYAVSQSAANNP